MNQNENQATLETNNIIIYLNMSIEKTLHSLPDEVCEWMNGAGRISCSK